MSAGGQVLGLLEGPWASTVEVLARRGADEAGELVLAELVRSESCGERRGGAGAAGGESGAGGKGTFEFGRLLSSIGLGFGKPTAPK